MEPYSVDFCQTNEASTVHINNRFRCQYSLTEQKNFPLARTPRNALFWACQTLKAEPDPEAR